VATPGGLATGLVCVDDVRGRNIGSGVLIVVGVVNWLVFNDC